MFVTVAMRCRSLPCIRCAILVLVGVVCLYTVLRLRWESLQAHQLQYDRHAFLRKLRGIGSSGQNMSLVPPGHQLCQRPHIPLYSRELLSVVWTAPNITCTMRSDWVSVKGSMAHITAEARDKYGPIECWFTAIMRNEDDATTYEGVTDYTRDGYHFTDSDFARVRCTAAEYQEWEGHVAGVRTDTHVRERTGWSEVPDASLHLDVLVIGFHAMSRAMFCRVMPKTYALVTGELAGVDMEGYNVVEKGKAGALFPLLTGYDELELPDVRRGPLESGKRSLDDFPFLWSDFARAGYVTAYVEDAPPERSLFSAQLAGFRKPPVDHYMRPFFLEAARNYSRHHDYCLGNHPRHKIVMNYLTSFYDVYRERPKFAFALFEDLNVNDTFQLMGSADADMAEWLAEMKRDKLLRQTVVVLLGDHGLSLPREKATLQAQMEERLPFLAFAFPHWFELSHPMETDVLRSNARRLVTPYDVHATLAAVVAMPTERGASLFGAVPAERSCEDAFVPPLYCACLRWGPTNQTLANMVGRALMEYINCLMDNNYARALCATLDLDHVVWYRPLSLTTALRNETEDNKRVEIVGEKGRKGVCSTQFSLMVVRTSPGGVDFEASVQFTLVESDRGVEGVVVQSADITRLNKEDGDAVSSCMRQRKMADMEDLSEICVCRDYARRLLLDTSRGTLGT